MAAHAALASDDTRDIGISCPPAAYPSGTGALRDLRLHWLVFAGFQLRWHEARFSCRETDLARFLLPAG